MKPHNLFLYFLAVLFTTSCTSSKLNLRSAESEKKSSVAREFRAAWVATVANINWPGKPGLPVDEQQKEAIALLDFLKDHNYNAVIFQVRPQADALYESKLEPWSYYLTGEQGKAPSPYYDPLSFWIEAAHDRGLELHVWLNPYRAHHVSGGPVSEHSLVKKFPELVVHLKEGYWWFDPSIKATQDHGVNVVMDIVRRYDIDGVHFDDYFYPYTSYNHGEDFPDTASRRAYLANGGKLSVADWRRESVNTFIQRLYREIKKEKEHVKFGISPFGIWRPGYPESIRGLDQYNELYADARLWLNEGWVDYFAPQLYWPISRIPQSFPVLLNWWSGENKQNRHLWPGVSIGRDTSSGAIETFNQIMITRGMLPESSGLIHWSLSSVIRNPAMGKMLLDGPYAQPALVPESPWLKSSAPMPPEASAEVQNDSVTIRWNHNPHDAEAFRWVVCYEYESSAESCKVFNRKEKMLQVPAYQGDNPLKKVIIRAVNRSSVESLSTIFTLDIPAKR